MALDLEAIKARYEAAEAAPAHPVGGLLDAWVVSTRDVPALVAEVERLREALDEAQLRSIEARNPGIDMEEVKRVRKAAP